MATQPIDRKKAKAAIKSKPAPALKNRSNKRILRQLTPAHALRFPEYWDAWSGGYRW